MMDVEEIGSKAPSILQFMPTKKVFTKLIKRATQISDEIQELNPYESKNDTRYSKDDVKMTIVNNMVVYAGVDEAFNSLRVFPPGELIYPDLIKDEDFYDRIGCPHLAAKYPSAEQQE
jgi:hypothetical protein